MSVGRSVGLASAAAELYDRWPRDRGSAVARIEAGHHHPRHREAVLAQALSNLIDNGRSNMPMAVRALREIAVS